MKLATLRDRRRDGTLVVVRHDHAAYAPAGAIAPTLQAALDDWGRVAPLLEALSRALDEGLAPSQPLDFARLAAPLPRAYEWVDASAFLHHVRLARLARGADVPPGLEHDPLVYQGGSGVLLGPRDDLVQADPAWGLDFEAEVCVVLGDTPQGTRREQAARHLRLVTLANDVTLRNLVPGELAKGFGFFQSKPATAFAPLALTPDELGDAWRDGRLHRRLRTVHNGRLAGDPDAGAMHFSFFELVEHLARTRSFTAGTVLGSGTVSNEDPARGVSCLAEARARETLEQGGPVTPWLQPGDTVEIEMLDDEGRSLFGKISQQVIAPR